jgi:hypothetical protein
MSTIQKNNIVSLYINSADRDDIKDSTTDFTISLRKSLRNISSLNVSNVIIPKNNTNININNNAIIGSINIDGILTPFSVELTTGNYTETSIATELQVKLNSNVITIIFGFAWTVVYNTVTRVIDINLSYAPGTTLNNWGVVILYTPLVDVLGIGSAQTTPRSFLTSLSNTLKITTGRAPTIINHLSYNITSKTLTDSIDTSYMQSLGRSFNVTPTNDTLTFDIDQTITNQDYSIPPGDNSLANFRHGKSVSISGNGNIIVTVGNFDDNTGALVFTRTLIGGVWTQITTPVVPSGFVKGITGKQSVSISSDGGTMVIGRSDDNSNMGAVWVFVRNGTEWTQQDKLVGVGQIGTYIVRGESVSLSSDGNTLAVGGTGDDSFMGATWIFTRSGVTWTQQDKLVGVGQIGTIIKQGESVALSSDGNTLAVGGMDDDSYMGATWIFTRSGVTWAQQDKLVGVGQIGTYIRQGSSVALSSDGNTLAVGGIGDDSYMGATWIFTRSGVTWAQQDKLVGVSTSTVSTQGESVSLSSDGNTLAVGGSSDDSYMGATWIFTRSGTIWAQQGVKLVGVGQIGALIWQGTSVALSSSGDVLVAGGPNDDNTTVAITIGALWVFERAVTLWSQTGDKLVGTGLVGPVQQGWSVEMSNDGNTMAVGGTYDGAGAGAVWVYVRTNLIWTQQDKLVGVGQIGTIIGQGTSVALSSDGNTLAVGGPGDNSNMGATWIFTRSGTIWTQQDKLVGVGQIGTYIRQGSSVALSSDGNTLAVGGIGDDSYMGATWIFTRSGTIWTQQDKLVGFGQTGGTYIRQGESVALSSDGNTLAVGGTGDDSFMGATWIFTRSGVTWTQQDKLVGVSTSAVSDQGESVALSSDGNTLAVGGTGDDSFMGATWIFTRSGTIWAQQGVKLVGVSTSAISNQGESVALSSDGNTLAVGGPLDISGTGATWIFTRSGTIWAPQGVKLVGTGFVGSSKQGTSVSLSGDGTNVAIGGPGNNNQIGKVWWTVLSGTYSYSLSVSLFNKAYTVFDIINELTTKLVLTPTITIVPVFDGTNTITLTMSTTGNIVAVFSVNLSSTFDAASWTSSIKALVQPSVSMDMTINNNIIKTVASHIDNKDNVTVDTSQSLIFRKYQAGFTLDVDEPIDIQLRDERDRIIDLNGANWIMTVFATIHS